MLLIHRWDSLSSSAMERAETSLDIPFCLLFKNFCCCTGLKVIGFEGGDDPANSFSLSYQRNQKSLRVELLKEKKMGKTKQTTHCEDAYPQRVGLQRTRCCRSFGAFCCCGKHDPKPLSEERVYFSLQATIHYQGKPGQEFNAGCWEWKLKQEAVEE